MAKPPDSNLIEFIEKKHPEYYGKICELREAIEGWLSYIPQTFPHYTRHTIKHSDKIIFQISDLLFRNDDATEPIVRLSGVEAYILVAAAYLHDAGMVTSDKEKAEILTSETWKKWTTGEGGGAYRWNQIQILRDDADLTTAAPVSDAAMRNFLADVQTRFLIAEFIRSQHHLRAATVIKVHHDQLGRIDLGDHMLRNAIAQVCIGHGLRLHELDDNERFPDLSDIRDEKVNLRFLAILLRLGDLLDMSVDRACPLLLSAASPLPPDSFPHWEQYQAITMRATSPQAIRITAECPNQEVHRVLQDWCQWIVDEVNHAKIVIPKCQRHSEWQIPDATIETDNPTIQIRRAENANYVPSKWVLQFDQQAIFERLSENLYSSPLEFIRELIQNSLDALRCRMYSDLAREGQEIPEYPTQASEEFRNRYSVKLSISTREIKNQMSGETETKQVLVIEDNGIGMDADIIEKYFLQVGRSYYTSDEFKRNFQFIPTSRFGIGFLSAFTVSDKIFIETYKPTSEIKNNEPIRLTLTGFRNYLLREKTDRQTAGTRIEIILRNDIKPGDLTKEVIKWCKRVEFLILVNDFGAEKTVRAERMEDFIYEQPLVTKPNAKFVMRAFPVNRPGIEGELYVLAYIDEQGESWSYNFWQINEYSSSHPMAKSPGFVSKLFSLHGITLNENDSRLESLTSRIDFRSGKYITNLDRSNFKSLVGNVSMLPELKERWEEILSEHLATSSLANAEDGWLYKQSLVANFPLGDFWNSIPGTIQIFYRGECKFVSLDELSSFNEIILINPIGEEYINREKSAADMKQIIFQLEDDLPIIISSNFYWLSGYITRFIYEGKNIIKVRQYLSDYLILNWFKHEGNIEILFGDEHVKTFSIGFPDLDLIGFKSPKSDYEIYLNPEHIFVKWLERVRNASLDELYNLKKELFTTTLNRIFDYIHYSNRQIKDLRNYLSAWREIPNLPEELYPPEIELTPEMFGRV